MLHHAQLIAAVSDVWERLGSVIGYVLVGIVTYVVTVLTQLWERRRAFKPHRSLEEIHHENIEINVRLDRCIWRIGPTCMRCYLGQYRNGERYLSDNEIVKKWRTHERVRDGVAPQMPIFDGILISRITEETQLVIDNGPSWMLVDDIREGEFKAICQAGGTTAIARYAVKNGKHIAGFIGVDLSADVQPEKLAEAMGECAVEINRILAGYVH